MICCIKKHAKRGGAGDCDLAWLVVSRRPMVLQNVAAPSFDLLSVGSR